MSNAVDMQFPPSNSSELPSQQPMNLDQQPPSSTNDRLRKENSPQSSSRPKNDISAHEQGPARDQDESLSPHEPAPESPSGVTLKRPQEPSSDNAPSPKRAERVAEEDRANSSAGVSQKSSQLITTGQESKHFSYTQWNPQTVPEYAKNPSRIPDWKRVVGRPHPVEPSISRSLAPAAAPPTKQESSDSEPYRPSPPTSPAPSPTRQKKKDAPTLGLFRQPPPTCAAPSPGLHIAQKLSTLDSARQSNLFEKHLEGIPEHLILSYLLEKNPKDPGMKIFNCARKIVEERLIRDAGYDLRDGTWSDQTPPSFAEHNESGRIILVAVPLMKGERGECNEKSSRWLAGACGLVVLHKIAPALVLRKSGMDLEIKVFTTKHNSDLGKLVERGIMEEYFQCVVDGFDDNKKPVERCTGLVKIERSENSFGWSRVPRFMHKSSTTWIPSNSARKTLGRIVDPNSLVAIAKAHKQGAEACSSHLMKVANNLEARAFGRLRIKSTGFTSKIPIPTKVSTIFLL